MIKVIILNFVKNHNLTGDFVTTAFLYDNLNELTFYKDVCKIYDSLTSNDKLKEFINKFKDLIIDKTVHNFYNYHKNDIPEIYIYLHEDCLRFEKFSANKQLLISKKHFLNDNIKGNCVDTFIQNGLESNLDSLNNFIYEIKGRNYERENSQEYHQTSCYEHDFYQLTCIKNILDKMVNLCDKQLQQMSEKYTKIN